MNEEQPTTKNCTALRDLFACSVAKALIGNLPRYSEHCGQQTQQSTLRMSSKQMYEIALEAYEMADALLLARNAGAAYREMLSQLEPAHMTEDQLRAEVIRLRGEMPQAGASTVAYSGTAGYDDCGEAPTSPA